MNQKGSRVEIAKSKLRNPENRDKKIIDIAFESGFNELSIFNDKFREETGMCPTEYRAFHINFKSVTDMKPEEYLMKSS